MVDRRKFITSVATAGTIAVAGCSSGGSGDGDSSGDGSDGSSTLEESGITSSSEGVIHNIELQEGETIRIVVDNEEGVSTIVSLTGAEDNQIWLLPNLVKQCLKCDMGICRVMNIEHECSTTYFRIE